MNNDYGNELLHKVLLSAMKDIDKICRENGLKYYLYAGTILGAVNHKGFIPWDDDVDIVMFPEDMKKFCEIIKEKYDMYYEMMTFDSNHNWYSKMNKLLVKGTKIISNTGEEHPIFIDISALHSIPNQRWRRVLQRKQIEWINLILSTQSGEIVPTSEKSKLILGNLAKISKNYWGHKLDKLMSKYDDLDTEYVGIMCNTLTNNPYTGKNGYENDITSRNNHVHGVYIPFEDTEFMTFFDYEKDLERRYGPRYREPYPEEKRVTKHNVRDYNIESWVLERC